MASASGTMGKAAKTGGRRAGYGTPVTAHPLFSTYAAVWFAALLGLSCLAVGTSNLERAVAALQLQALIPAAAPPLGMTARALIATAMALLGAGVGLVVARWLAPKDTAEPRARSPRPSIAMPRVKRARRARAKPPVAVRARDVHPDAPVRRPIFAHEEFGDSGCSEDAAAVQDMEALRAGRIGQAAPDDLDLPSFLVSSRSSAHRPSPLLSPTREIPLEGAFHESAGQPHGAGPARQAPRAPFGLPPGEAAERIASTVLSDLSPVELLERFAIALQRRQDRPGTPLSPEQAARVAAIGEAALALGREALADIEGASRTAAAKKSTNKLNNKPGGLAVVAPQPSPQDTDAPDETEQALRHALASLQRMTGAA